MKSSLLRAERRRRGWSQAKVAEAVGVNLSTVRRWERGRAVPYPYYRKKLATLFGKTAEELGFLSGANENDVLEDVQPSTLAIPTQQTSPQLVSSLVEEGQTYERETQIPGHHLPLPQSRWNVDILHMRHISNFFPFKRFSWHFLHIPSKISLPAIAILAVLLAFIMQPLLKSVQRINTSIMQSLSPTASVTTTLGRNYEAEARENTLAGGAKVFDCSACFGGKRVGDIGRNGTLQFNNVMEKSTDTYRLTIYYVYGGNGRRPLYINVNNRLASVVTVLGTGNWNVVETVKVTISLHSGNNTIKLYNPGHSAPDIDRIFV